MLDICHYTRWVKLSIDLEDHLTDMFQICGMIVKAKIESKESWKSITIWVFEAGHVALHLHANGNAALLNITTSNRRHFDELLRLINNELEMNDLHNIVTQCTGCEG